ncbi:glycoside hydrolase family 107 [Wenyingzhuangia fucanilytica]|uniref:Glycoside hydrolase family 107 n=1 Tax=Wenyingzhuangia fucanilytica TaxID=1790137 RepID=A0A1B1Y5R4_9FLAO|nr:T9SS type A sorting domain-containing protein [Wenyingzhuangia fucanilytica]ANW96116.1 glycoside hydrolase family 107 [Wenyingzhuangia fucanilytica]
MKTIKSKKHYNTFILLQAVCVMVLSFTTQAQTALNPEQGLRANWMRGALGLLWLPERNYNGNIEGVEIDEFISQVKDLRTIDYVQLPLTSPNIFSPVHVAPHSIIESLWEGDTDSNGDPINLVVPRESVDDPLLRWLKALKAEGLRVEIYVNSYNLLARNPEDTQTEYPDVSDRWMEWCDTNAEAQAFLNTQTYHNGSGRRYYMFCYAEFILKEYAIRYGDLIDAWCFDSADNIMEDECGDNPDSENVEDQRIYQAFANAVHAGNPNAAVAFNNSVGDRVENPFSTATLFDDYTFGHPFGGAGNMVENETLYRYNYHVIEWMQDYAGDAFLDDTRDWNDKVVSHFFPKQSSTSWNAGSTPCLTDEQFVEWTTNGIIDGGAITWGTPLIRTNLENSPELVLRDYALTQLTLTDDFLKEFQYPGAPNWARQHTVLPPAHIGIPYHHVLVEGVDLWDPEGDEITEVIALGNFPSWLKITEKSPGEWTFSGTPTETNETTHTFSLQASDASGVRTRVVNLLVDEELEADPIAIKASSNTNYGLNNKAVMVSDVYTAPDGYATFRVSMDVTPPTDQAIVSGISGGTTTENSWGIGNGTDGTQDVIFRGSDNEWVQNINNLQIVDFNANGGDLTEDHFTLSFKAITIVNAQSTNDFVSLKFDQTVVDLGKLGNQTQQIDLNSVSSINEITEFSLGTGNDSSTNKWSVEEILISLNLVVGDLSNSTIVSEKKQGFKVYPSPTSHTINFNIPIHSVEVINTSGKVVKINPNLTQSIKISDLSSGVYIIKGVTELGVTVVKKIVKNTN